MKFDKMGGLAVLGMMLASADLKLPLNIIGLIPPPKICPALTRIGPATSSPPATAKPSRCSTPTRKAASSLPTPVAHARLTYKPSAILEYSTLTGAVIMALGHRRAGMFTSAEKLRDAFMAAGKSTGELVWPMPIDDEYKENVLSEIATAKNTSFREGSACSSASFVKLWAEETPFVHFDIAGTAWTTKPHRPPRRRRDRLRPPPHPRRAPSRAAGLKVPELQRCNS